MMKRFCLIVDDSPTVRKVARRVLEDLQFEVDEASNGQIALEKCGSRMPDAVLLDWNMPCMNGIEFLCLLRRMEHGGKPRVVLCTTETGVEHIKTALEAGADEYLMKPFDTEALAARFSADTVKSV